MMLLYIETPEMLVCGEEYNFVQEGVYGIGGHLGKLFSRLLQVVNYIRAFEGFSIIFMKFVKVNHL